MQDHPSSSTGPDDDADPTEQWTASSAGLPSTGESAADCLPREFGQRYRAEREIGAGGYGSVYAGYDSELRRPVAIKVARADRPSHSTEAFLREAQHLAKLNHESILRVYDVGLDQGERFIVTDLVDGVNLHQWMRNHPPTFQQIATIIAHVADGLAHAHSERIVHRDVKPGNILMTGEGRPILADFGLALTEEEMAFGPDRKLRGTFPYMSPEQARGEGHRIDGRTDIYSLGVVFYELLCGKRPFRSSNRSELLRQIRDDEPQPPRQLNRRIPESLERICLRAMSKRVKDRYVTAADFATELRQVEELTAPTVAETDSQATAPLASDRESSSRDVSRAIRIVPKGARSFDRSDQAFFLELIPGPRDSGGLPESLRFWKNRIEQIENMERFSVGVLYGPSGSGKSSLVRAGLLPNLDDDVRSIWLEASPTDTEAKLKRALRKCLRGLPQDAPLNQVFAAMRSERVNHGRKTLIVIDQFEQWLNEYSGDIGQTELASALRQADGQTVQVLLLVRDDFWLGITRLFEYLELKLDPDFNMRCVDLFDKRHAHRVLAAFGHAYGQLPESRADLDDDQKRFLNQAVDELSEDGMIVPVRLSLFAELMKSRAWTLQTLRDVGGTQGVGVRFLEESFTSRAASPETRLLESHARALLSDLLPKAGSQIRGRMRSRSELAATCELDVDSPKLDRLLEILDRQLHIVTPAEAAEMTLDTNSELDSTNESTTSSRVTYYQLAHDYLVGSLRQWLTFERQKTWQGRAAIRLEELAGQMRQWPRSNYLPTLSEYLRIGFGVPRGIRNADQSELMRRAGRHHGLRVGIAAVGLAVLAFLIAAGVGEFRRQQRVTEVERQVARLLVETPAEASQILKALDEAGELAMSPLRTAAERKGLTAEQELRLGIALDDDDMVFASGLKASPDELQLVGWDQQHDPQLMARFEKIVADTNQLPEQRLRAAALLAASKPGSQAIRQASETLASELVTQDLLWSHDWIRLLKPAKKALSPYLKTIFADDRRPKAALFATSCLADFYEADLAELMALLREAPPSQIPVLAEKVGRHPNGVSTLVNEIAPPGASDNSTQAERLELARRSAKAGLSLLLCRQREDAIRSLLQPAAQPDARSYFIRYTSVAEVAPKRIVDLLATETNPDRQASLIRVLGGYHPGLLSPALRSRVVTLLEPMFHGQKHSGLHYAIDWQLRQWRLDDQLKEWKASLTSSKPKDGMLWMHTPKGHDLVVIPAPGSIQVADLPRMDVAHTVEINYAFAIGAKEVTYWDMLQSNNPGRLPDDVDLSAPVSFASFDAAAEYCNWLSDAEEIKPDDWCYEISDGGVARLKSNFMNCKGYRLPLTHEAEYAARGRTTTARYFGDDLQLITDYSATMANFTGAPASAGSFMPNDFGLFDSIGNMTERCHLASDTQAQYLRGGHFRGPANKTLSTTAIRISSHLQSDITGFRVVRVLAKP